MLDRDYLKEDWEMKFRDEYYNFLSLKFLGLWWVPNDPEYKINGTLEIIKGKETYLDLIGSFRKDDEDRKHFDIILGLSSEGKKITLNRCIEKCYSSSMKGFPISIYEISVSFIGAHFNHLNEIFFDKIKIRYPYLDEWIWHNYYTGKYDMQKNFVLQYNEPPVMEFLVADDYSLSFKFDIIRPPTLSMIREPYMRHISFVILEFVHSKNFEEIHEITTHIKYLMSFAINRPINTIMIQGITKESKENVSGTVTIFQETTAIPKQIDNILHFDMFFTLPEVLSNFGKMINNWISKADVLESVYDLYFSTIYQPLMRLRHKFLSRIHALEIYHRNTKRNYELEISEHEIRIVDIVESVPDKYKGWLENKLVHSNEPTLRKRVGELIEEHYYALSEIIEDKNIFIQKLITTRNYFIHYDQQLKYQAAKGVELYKITQICKIIIDVCLLAELGFDKEDIKKLSLRNWEYKYGLQKV